MNPALPVERAAIIGLGLIGSSVARVLREQGLAKTIVASGRSEETLQRGVQLGVIDEGYASVAEAARGADLVILAMPVGATEKVLSELKPVLSDRMVVTDVGSVKANVVEAARRVFGELPARFVPGHPIAGSEKSGVEAGSAQLFLHHKVILTPSDRTDASALALVETLWLRSGAQVLKMGVEEHDLVLAKTSHLPHLLAFSLVDTLAKESENREIFRYAAGGFRDFTRIAASDPVMWHDIFLANRDAVLTALQHFSAGVDILRQALIDGDGATLLGVFTRAKAAREHFSHMLAKTAYTNTMKPKNLVFRLSPGGSVRGDIRVPGDKSISHRSIMLGSLADGVTEVEGFLEGEDALATLQAFRDMGVVIEGPQAGRVKIHGVGIDGLKAAPGPLYLGNSGTSMRLLSGILSAQSFDSVMTGDESLSRRPMERVAKPLRAMGAEIVTTGDRGTPPVTIKGGQGLHGMCYDMPVASAQVKSGILLAGLWAQGETVVTEPAPTRDHTERMLRGFGYPVIVEGATVRLQGGGRLKATRIDVPADISSAAFFMVAASIAEGSEILLRHVGVNPTRTGVIDILRLMGADITLENSQEVGGEPVADIRVRSAALKGIRIPEALVPLAIDEFPVLFVAAACAEGETVLTGAEELRVKESDRIQVMADGLKTVGIQADPTPDGIVIQGGIMGGGIIDSHGDHRIAMAFAVASLRATEAIIINDCANVATSFPGFAELAAGLGIQIAVQEQ